MTFGDTVNENVQESLIHKAVWQSCINTSGHATITKLSEEMYRTIQRIPL